MNLVAATVPAPPDGVVVLTRPEFSKNLLLDEGGEGFVQYSVQLGLVVFDQLVRDTVQIWNRVKKEEIR